MSHRFRFSTSGNPTKHMPIGYWSLWGPLLACFGVALRDTPFLFLTFFIIIFPNFDARQCDHKFIFLVALIRLWCNSCLSPPSYWMCIAENMRYLTLARFPCFVTFASGEGVGATPPWRSIPDARRASRKKTVEASRRDLAIAHIICRPRSIFDLVKSGQSQIFANNDIFWLYTLIAA